MKKHILITTAILLAHITSQSYVHVSNYTDSGGEYKPLYIKGATAHTKKDGLSIHAHIDINEYVSFHGNEIKTTKFYTDASKNGPYLEIKGGYRNETSRGDDDLLQVHWTYKNSNGTTIKHGYFTKWLSGQNGSIFIVSDGAGLKPVASQP